MKLARYFGEVPPGKAIIFGWLHDCETTNLTDRCREPNIDESEWIQYCFCNPNFLGTDRLFIEFVVNWAEWKDDPDDTDWEDQAKETMEMGRLF